MAAAEFPDDDNGDALRHMAEQGVNLGVSHQVDFEHVFPDEKSARSFEEGVAELIASSKVHAPDEEDPEQEWEVQCRIAMVPTHEKITAVESQLEAVAAQFGGYSDGWGLCCKPDGTPA